MATLSLPGITRRPVVFSLIWIGQFLSLLGSSLTSFALGVQVYQTTGSATQFALISFAATVPSLVLSPIAGALVDRWDRRWTMILSDMVAGIGTLLIWWVVQQGQLQIWHIYLATAISAIGGAFQWPAYAAVTTVLVSKAQLGRANGMVQIAQAVCQILAPLIAGFLLGFIGLSGIIQLDVASFLVAVSITLLVRVPRPEVSEEGRAAKGTLRQEAAAGWQYVRQRTGLYGLLLFYALKNLTQGMVVVLVTPLVLSFTNAAELGIVMAVGGLGMVVGAIVVGIWPGERRGIAAIFGASAAQALVLTLAGAQPSVALVATAVFLFLFAVPVITAASQTIWQRKVPADMQGRVFAVRRMVASGLIPVAYLIAGPLADYGFEPLLQRSGVLAASVGSIIGTGPGRGIALIFIVMGLLNLLITMVAYLNPEIRQVETRLPDVINAPPTSPDRGTLDKNEEPLSMNPKRRGRLGSVLRGIGVLLLLVIIVAVVGAIWRVRAPYPQESGTLSATGLQAPVDIVRDDLGIPNIYAENEHDLFFAQGYVHAQDRLWQMDFNRRAGRGTVSELVGAAGLSTDRSARTLGLYRAAEAEWETLDEDTKTILTAYADGVNAYIATHGDKLPVEYAILGGSPTPWSPVDTLLWGKTMARNLGLNASAEFIRARYAAIVGEPLMETVFPLDNNVDIIIPHDVDGYAMWDDDATMPESAALVPPYDPVTTWGSNGWVVAGSRTTTGKPLLANDTHLALGMPSVWYLNGLHGGRFDVVGFSFPGVPMVISGQNERIAWGITNLVPDTQDSYIEKLNDETNPTQYEFEGAWQDLEILTETIQVKGQDPVIQQVYLTNHGPLLNEVRPDLAGAPPTSVRWTLSDADGLVVALKGVNLATQWDEFRAALSHWTTPGQNFVYADVDGNIGHQAAGKVPIRAEGHQGSVPVPGWTGEYEWQGFVPFDELPSTYNPPEGYFVNANNRVTPPDYAYVLSYEWPPNYRKDIISQALDAETAMTVERMESLQQETYSLHTEALLPLLKTVTATTEQEQTALDYLNQWDGHYTTDAIGASVFQVWYQKMVENIFGDDLGELTPDYMRLSAVHLPVMATLIETEDVPWFDDSTTPEVEDRNAIIQRSFSDAVVALAGQLGENPDEWAWGRLHIIRLRHTPIGSTGIPPLELIFNSPTIEGAGETYSVNASGYSYAQLPYAISGGSAQRFVADLSNPDQSVAINTTGQSGHIFHPHYQDQTTLFFEGRYHPLVLTRAALDGGQTQTLTLTPP